LCFFSGPF